MRLHWIMMIDWFGIRLVNDYAGFLDNGINRRNSITKNCHFGWLPIYGGRRKSMLQSSLPGGHGLLWCVIDLNQSRSVTSLLEGFSNYQPNNLAVITNSIVL